MGRAIWKGAISFGLVHIPVAVYPAEQDSGIDFDWLDRRSLDPVGYKRYNKRTGKDLKPEDIVKGVKQPDGDYVVVAEDEIKAAFPASTQTIEIDAFVKASEIPLTVFERPYYTEPAAKAERVYALLRAAMSDADVVAIARVVMHTKEHLAVLVPSGPMLVLNTIRWASELRSTDGLKIPGQGLPTPALKPTERKMAAQLVAEMTSAWKPSNYTERFSTSIRALIKKKVAAGDAQHVEPLEAAPGERAPSNVVDLTELLAQSLAGHRPARAGAATTGAKRTHQRAVRERGRARARP